MGKLKKQGSAGMRTRDVFPAWRRILQGHKPLLSIEITKECPLRCPGCYAYEPQHLDQSGPLRQLGDYRGDDLIHKVLALVERYRPIHISIVGGEPLVRYRELDVLLPELARRRIEVQLVTSAVRPIPAAWARIPDLHLVVSVDGLEAEHNTRRSPATYERILRHIEGHRLIVHCTVTGKTAGRAGYFAEFARFWSARPEVRRIWFSLYTPQEGDTSAERLSPEARLAAIADLAGLRAPFPKVHLPEAVVRGLRNPPRAPGDCLFSQVTECLTADLRTGISPCQFGGRPVCAECGCLASAGMKSVGEYRLGGLVRVADIFTASRRAGNWRVARRGPGPVHPGAAEHDPASA